MDKHTLSNYGFLLVATILVAALLAVLSPVTPFGDYVRSSINEVVDNYIEKTNVEEVKNKNENIVPDSNNIDTIRKITINLLYEDGKQIQESIVIEIKHGETLNVQEKLPVIEGYTPTNVPKKSTIINDETYNIVYVKNLYSIEYVTNGGAILSTKPMSYLYGETIELPTNVVKEGYYFAGWYQKSDFSDEKLYEITPQIKGDLTLYARWEKNAYTITYISNGKEITNIANKYKTAFYGESIVLPVLTAQGGKNFGGWYTNKYFEGNNIVSTPQYPKENLTYYAFWTNDGYRIDYVTNGGTFNGTYPTIYTSGQKIILPTNITKNGYELVGWYTDSSYTTKVTEIASTDYGNKVFYAKWKYATYKIAYDLNGGSATGSLVEEYTYNPTSSPLTYNNNVSKSGYVFAGWKDVDLGTIEQGINAGRYGDIVLIAQYVSKTYEITYNANGGLPENSKFNIKYGDTYGDGPVVTKDGCEFTGWYTSASGGNKVLATDIYDSDENEILYAHWSSKTYNITYIVDGGTFSTTPTTTYTYGVGLTLPTNISKNNYIFDGWYLSSDFTTEEITSISTKMFGDKTLYAKWLPATYSIAYDTQGGEITDNNCPTTYTYGIGIETLPVPQKTGYNFTGWKDNDNQIIFGITATDSGNKALTAQWKLKDAVVNIILTDTEGNELYNSDGESLSFSQAIQPNTEYAFIDDYFTNLYSINKSYYHESFDIKYTEQQCIDADFELTYKLECYTYRTLNIVLYLNNQLTELSEDSELKPVYYFKQSQHQTATLTIPEYLNNKMWILKDNGLGGKTVEQYVGNGGKTLKIYYDPYTFNIIWDYDSSTEIPTATLPTTYCYGQIPFTVPVFTKDCYVFNGYTVTNGTATSGTSTYSITPSSPADVTLKPKWTRSTVASAHNMDTGVVTTAAKCTTKGVKTYTCKDGCGYSYTKSIDALGHSSTYGGTKSVHTKCSRSGCGVTLSSTHSYSSSVQTAATCTAKGTTKYTCACGYYYTSQDIAALGHSYTSSTYKSISSTQHQRKCTRCSSYGATANHSLSTKTTAATCSAAGKKTTSCSKCDYSTSSRIAKLSHDFTKKCTTTHNPANTYTVGKTGWYCINSSCYKYDSNNKYGHNSKPNPNFVHKACRYCEKNYGRRGCAAHESFSSSMTCKCTSHGSAWRCSNSWCRQYWTGGEDDWLNGEFKTKDAW